MERFNQHFECADKSTQHASLSTKRNQRKTQLNSVRTPDGKTQQIPAGKPGYAAIPGGRIIPVNVASFVMSMTFPELTDKLFQCRANTSIAPSLV